MLLDGRCELTHAMRLLMHEELRVHKHTMALRTTREGDRGGLGRRGTHQVHSGAGRGGVWGPAVRDGDWTWGGTSC